MNGHQAIMKCLIITSAYRSVKEHLMNHTHPFIAVLENHKAVMELGQYRFR